MHLIIFCGRKNCVITLIENDQIFSSIGTEDLTWALLLRWSSVQKQQHLLHIQCRHYAQPSKLCKIISHFVH